MIARVPPVRLLVTVVVGSHEEFLAITRPSYEGFATGTAMSCGRKRTTRRQTGKQDVEKIAYIRDLLPDCDELLWIDSDAAIVDMSGDIALDVPRRRFLSLVEHHYRGQHVPNTGVMFIRSGARADRFFREMWDMTDYLDHGVGGQWGDTRDVRLPVRRGGGSNGVSTGTADGMAPEGPLPADRMELGRRGHGPHASNSTRPARSPTRSGLSGCARHWPDARIGDDYPYRHDGLLVSLGYNLGEGTTSP